MYSTLAVHGYRSLRDVVVRLLAACGQGDVAGSLAREGGLDSVLWAGPKSLAAARRVTPWRARSAAGPSP